MAEIKIDVQALRNRFREYGQAVTQEAVPVALERGALVVEREAKRRAPVDDGHLRRSITHRIVKQGLGDETEMVAQVGTNLHYAIHVEYGHRTPRGMKIVGSRSYKGRKVGTLSKRLRAAHEKKTVMQLIKKRGKGLLYVPGRFFLKGALEAKAKSVRHVITKYVQQAGEEIKR